MNSSSPLPFLLLPFLLLPFLAHAGVKSISKTLPRYGQRGTTVEVEIQGVSLDNPREIIFFKPGIRAFDLKKKEKPPSLQKFAHGNYIDAAITCKFEISPDCPPGEYPFRLLTATELTHMGTFHVSPFRTIDEGKEPNNSIDQAMPVEPNVTIKGQLGYEPHDFFRVPVKAGQPLSIELISVRLSDKNYGGSTFDLALRVLDQSGKQIAANDDNSLRLQDPVLSLKTPFDGQAFIVVERSTEQPARTPYALHISTNRRPMIAYPPGGPAGAEQTIRMIGDATGDYDVQVSVPKQTGPFDYFGGAPTALKLRSSSFPNIIESCVSAETLVEQLPAALNGIIESRDDIDYFRLVAKKDVPLHIRVFSAGLGSPIDPRIKIWPIAEDGTEGEVEEQADDASLPERDIFGTSYRGGGGRPDYIDPSIIWNPKKDGEYLLEISDSSGMGGPTGVYRIEIEQPRTVVQTVLWSGTNDWSESTRVTGLGIPQGGRWTVNVSLPSGQFNRPTGAFDLIALGLPKGVRVEAPRVAPDVKYWPLQFIAEPDAPTVGAVITLAAKPVDPFEKIENRSQENIPFINHSGGNALHHVQVDRYILGVTDPAPFSLEIEPPTAALVQRGELSIPVRIKRREGFTGPIEYWVGFVHRAISYQPPTTIEAGETESILRLTAGPATPLGKTPLVVLGRSLEGAIHRSMGVGDRRASSKIVHIDVEKSYVLLSADPESIRRGESKMFVFNANHQTSFEGEARVRLLGLPKGVSTTSTPILKSGTKSIAFELTATSEALLGQATGLSCEVMLTVAGQTVTQRTGNASLRIDPRSRGGGERGGGD